MAIRKSDKEIPSLLQNITPRDLSLERTNLLAWVPSNLSVAFAVPTTAEQAKQKDSAPRFHKQLRG